MTSLNAPCLHYTAFGKPQKRLLGLRSSHSCLMFSLSCRYSRFELMVWLQGNLKAEKAIGRAGCNCTWFQYPTLVFTLRISSENQTPGKSRGHLTLLAFQPHPLYTLSKTIYNIVLCTINDISKLFTNCLQSKAKRDLMYFLFGI